jgi:hypothetical protein
MNDSTTFAGVSTEVVQPQSSMNDSTTFAGASTEVVQPQSSMNDSTTFAGVSTEVVQPQLSMRTNTTFAGSSTQTTQGQSAAFSSMLFAVSSVQIVQSQISASANTVFPVASTQVTDANSSHGATAWAAAAVFTGVGVLSVDAQTVTAPIIVGADTLCLVSNPDISFITPDDRMTYQTTTIFMELDPKARGLKSLVFQTPHNGYVTIEQSQLSIGQQNVITPKGLFPAGSYLVYHTTYYPFIPGVWQAFWSPNSNGAAFYVSK